MVGGDFIPVKDPNELAAQIIFWWHCHREPWMESLLPMSCTPIPFVLRGEREQPIPHPSPICWRF